jgi:hypothetical protein
VIAASLVAIEKGAYFFATMPPEVEILLHALCGFVGAIAFVGYVTPDFLPFCTVTTLLTCTLSRARHSHVSPLTVAPLSCTGYG